ncbi:MAG: hypothetical protein KUA35_02225 [Pseudodesulfovibrio sp.]|uniref:Uncharacterized protein n=1 Tax=Pseudodesulfovibrio aespoeensis (strain ATCC 700646 / DSM 10631 / Aspo-2) TaxID=643562 RepID=E6VUT0_PSEA9|nr:MULTISPECIES: hypothetical protein [Pseudodesulfovibrio]MBU4191381.1 hypothetical protein [Pseudomonadota bacterium]ADU62321.1 hypothetical protein Daes_1307 [Pseudodesulfovibrio aespoeensis Aspo-2]MBU4244047.1 hypothetical protein [Pseudomonadota bacterium]MBU4380051.1 hypothetical protein [Pseudomonadota bacterium]MBU4474014.1 hypothetical protein [Pseudomonadota bacterium]
MTIPLILSGLCLGIFLAVRAAMSGWRDRELGALETRNRAVRAKYEAVLARKRDLTRELEDKEHALASLRNNGEGIKAISTHDLDMDGSDETERVSRYLLSQGKVSLEQSQKAQDKMGTLQMDYLAVCLTLGFIDLSTAKAASKIAKQSEKPAAKR